ncbi:MAG: zinc-binding dehydrogenase [Sphingobacterium sp.]|jgi:NADPH2:quinone reductase|nr:zinc-binding dehydrogenase [Sphingobacterium sp.]
MMQAIVMTTFGGPEVLELRSVNKPFIRTPNEVLIRVIAAGVNAGDLKIREGDRPLKELGLPEEGVILGFEGAGIVEAVGANVSRFKVGDEVYYYDGGVPGIQGNYAQFKALDENYVAHKPKSLSFAEAASLPVIAIASWESLHDRIRLQKGDYLLVQGGAGGLGHIGIQLGKILGAHVATTVSNEDKAKFVKDMGADKIIRYKNENIKEAIQEWTQKNGVDAIYDTVGDAVFSQSIDLLDMHGRIVSPAFPTAWPTSDIVSATYRNIQISFEAMGHALSSPEARIRQTGILENVATLVDDDRLHVELDRTYDLKDLNEAHRALENGEIVGKSALIITH